MQVPFCTASWGARSSLAAIAEMHKSDAPWNESYYSNEELDSLLEAVESEPDFDKRKDMFDRMQEIITEDIPRIIPSYWPALWAQRDYVMGIPEHPQWYFLLREAWLDK
jgi:peptide/nickel transport system substrate-binding protein